VVLVHTWKTTGPDATAFGADDTEQRVSTAVGTAYRLRLINTNNQPTAFTLTGASFKIAAVDGTDLHEPQTITNKRLLLAAGGRYDVTFTMPASTVLLKGEPVNDDNKNIPLGTSLASLLFVTDNMQV